MGTTFSATLSVAVVMVAGSALAQSGNDGRGERLFNQQCKACHTVEKGGASPLGPNLNGVFGRKAGTAGGYQSSEAMIKSGIVWDDKTLAEYLKDPKARVPGGKMVYVGIKQETQLEDMIAFLKKAAQ